MSKDSTLRLLLKSSFLSPNVTLRYLKAKSEIEYKLIKQTRFVLFKERDVKAYMKCQRSN